MAAGDDPGMTALVYLRIMYLRTCVPYVLQGLLCKIFAAHAHRRVTAPRAIAPSYGSMSLGYFVVMVLSAVYERARTGASGARVRSATALPALARCTLREGNSIS